MSGRILKAIWSPVSMRDDLGHPVFYPFGFGSEGYQQQEPVSARAAWVAISVVIGSLLALAVGVACFGAPGVVFLLVVGSLYWPLMRRALKDAKRCPPASPRPGLLVRLRNVGQFVGLPGSVVLVVLASVPFLLSLALFVRAPSSPVVAAMVILFGTCLALFVRILLAALKSRG